jgi:hypothetical protein
MASETELRLFTVSRHAMTRLHGRLRLAVVFLELLRKALRRFGVSLQPVLATASPAHGPDALSLASVDAGDEPRGGTPKTHAAGRTTAPKRRAASTLDLNFRVRVEPSEARAG